MSPRTGRRVPLPINFRELANALRQFAIDPFDSKGRYRVDESFGVVVPMTVTVRESALTL